MAEKLNFEKKIDNVLILQRRVWFHAFQLPHLSAELFFRLGEVFFVKVVLVYFIVAGRIERHVHINRTIRLLLRLDHSSIVSVTTTRADASSVFTCPGVGLDRGMIGGWKRGFWR